uniref:O-fucosyltransferase family protein n=1 Tax=Ananas comosus var. bracteatus TaxID=296719 RepID=A0A6V7NIT4_ANACO|nr:unnamed protein product [Ananas comosus var. bracteatus]
MLKQIKLNREIQEALLSSHRFENTRLDPLNNNVGFDPSVLEFNVCQKVDKPAERRTIEWKPKKDRYLLAICLSGQMSNHLICLEKHMFFAALLDRVLILPSHVVDYQYERVLDIDHINRCFGRNIVVSFEEFRKMKLGISLGKIEAAWPEDAKLKEQEKRIADDIRSKFSSDVEVLAVGDLFYADVDEECLAFSEAWVPEILDGTLVRRPDHSYAEKWDALLYRNHIGGDIQVEAMLDKTICALSNVFVGSAGSTFTEDIRRLRRGWGSVTQCDEYLCQGELPNYIAEQE